MGAYQNILSYSNKNRLILEHSINDSIPFWDIVRLLMIYAMRLI